MMWGNMCILNPYVFHLYAGLKRSLMDNHNYICHSQTIYNYALINVLSTFGNWQISFYTSNIGKCVLHLMTDVLGSDIDSAEILIRK